MALNVGAAAAFPLALVDFPAALPTGLFADLGGVGLGFWGLVFKLLFIQI